MAANLFGLTETQLRNWIARGIPPTQRTNGRLFIDSGDLARVLSQRA